jgi:Tol biopolymer transport system component
LRQSELFNPTVQTIAAFSVETGEMKQISSKKFARIEQISWLADGKNLLLVADEAPALPLKVWQVAYPSGEVKGFSNDLNEYSSVSITADANALATMQTVRTQNIWITPVNGSERSSQITSGSDRSSAPVWTPDGRIVFAGRSRENWELYLVDPKVGTPKQLTADSGSDTDTGEKCSTRLTPTTKGSGKWE